MEPWKKIEEEIEEIEESEEEFQELIDETPVQAFIRRQDADDIRPFLETEPIENLEQDLQDVPRTASPRETAEPAYASAVADYAGNDITYDAAAYQEGYFEQTGGMETGRNLTEVPRTGMPFERDVNMNAWRHQAMQGYPGEEKRQRQRDYTPAPAKFQQDLTGLPPQRRTRDRRLR